MKKIQIFGLLFIIAILSTVPARADDSFVFHESVVKGESFDWNIEKLQQVYEEEEEDDLPFREGDTLNVIVSEDPADENITNFSNVFTYEVNNVKVKDEDMFGVLFLMVFSGAFGLFIAPLELNDKDFMTELYNAYIDYASSWNDYENGTAVVDRNDKTISLQLEDFDGDATIYVYTEYERETGFLNKYEIKGEDDDYLLHLIISKPGGGIVPDFISDLVSFQFVGLFIGIASIGLLTYSIRRRKRQLDS